MIFSRSKSTTNKTGLWQKLRSGLGKTRALLLTDVGDLFNLKNRSDDELLDEVEARLLAADVGVESTRHIVDGLKRAMKSSRVDSADDLVAVLQNQMVNLLRPVEAPLQIKTVVKPFTLLVVGVNGAGKTTTIGKLAHLFRPDYRVMLAAGDTFRAAAIEQLQTWGERNQIPVIAHTHGADSAAVVYDSLQAARNQNADILIADTAGRLQNKDNLIEELKKIRRTITKFDSGVEVETLLVLDASNGQNALVQARQFHEAIGITGIVLTKLDGTAKGGIVFAIATTLGIPIRFIGTGEKIDDLDRFDAESFVSALLSPDP